MNGEVREFAFSKSDFNKVRAMLYDLSGINLSDNKDSMVYSRLARRLRALRLSNLLAIKEFGVPRVAQEKSPIQLPCVQLRLIPR